MDCVKDARPMSQKLADSQPKFWMLAIVALFAGTLVLVKGMNMEWHTLFDTKVSPPSVFVASPKPASIAVEQVTPQTQQGGTVLFAGDMQWDRYIRQMGEQYGYDYILEEVTPRLQQADVVVANLEGPVTGFESKSLTSTVGSRENYIFTFSPSILPVLKKSKIEIVNLGNNHILNFGTEGLAETKLYLDQHNIKHFGNTGTSNWLEESFLPYELHGLSILFVNFNQFIESDREALLAEIVRRDSEYDTVVLYTHWGNEYMTEASELYQTWAHEFVDAGVDLVIGSHPHVVQQKEEYKGKTIYYSLGNFVFDQYFESEPRKGLLVEANFAPDGTYVLQEIPVFLEKNGKTVLQAE